MIGAGKHERTEDEKSATTRTISKKVEQEKLVSQKGQCSRREEIEIISKRYKKAEDVRSTKERGGQYEQCIKRVLHYHDSFNMKTRLQVDSDKAS